MRRTKSTLWPWPEYWGERQKRHPYRRRLLNYECDQQMWTPQSAAIIGGRRVGNITVTPWWFNRRSRPAAPTVSVALLRQRLARGMAM